MTDVDLEAWRAQVREDLGGREPDALRWRSVDGVLVEPLYTEKAGERGVPGAPPFVRGSEPAREWLVVEEPRGADREAVLAGARRALDGGADAIWITPAAASRVGAALEPLAALGAPVWIEGGDADAWVAAKSATITVLSDPLAARADLEPALARLAQVLERAATALPSARPILVSSRPYHEAGAAAVDELALLITSGIAYLRGLSDAGRPLADLPRRMLFELPLDADFFLGIAKLRAARLLWSKVLRTIGVDGPEQGMRIRARSSRRAATTLDPQLGVLRGTAAAFAAVAGGAELVTVAPYDELCREHDHHAERLARTTQLVLREEAELGRVLDPGGGSYFLESLTDQLARKAWAVMQEIEHLGGLPRGLADGSIDERVAAGAEARRKGLTTGALGMVAVNRYPSPDAPCLASESLPPMRDAAPFEAIRSRTAALPLEKRRALVVAVGDARALRPRMDFAREQLAVAGLDIEVSVHPSAAEALAVDVPPVVIPVASDEDYPALAREIIAPLRERGARAVVLATRPTDALREAGADAFVHRGADLVRALEAVLDALEAA